MRLNFLLALALALAWVSKHCTVTAQEQCESGLPSAGLAPKYCIAGK